MKGQSLRYLAGVADLARLDIEAAGITLIADETTLTACYAGAYSRGYRVIPCTDGPFHTSVSAQRFKVIASTFDDDDEVACSTPVTGLRLRSRNADALLSKWGEESELPEFDRKHVELAVRLPASDLIREIEMALPFVARSQVSPILTGIVLGFGKALEIIAFDGGGVLYRSTIKARIKGTGMLIVPAQDLLLGARLINDGDAIIAKPEGRDAIIIYNDRALFRSAVLAGIWPDLSKVIAQQNSITLKVHASRLASLVTSAKILGAGPDISVRPRKGYVLFGSKGEAGSFTVAVKGAIDTSLYYDAETLGSVARLGDMLTFRIASRPNEPTIVEAGPRKCWVVTRI